MQCSTMLELNCLEFQEKEKERESQVRLKEVAISGKKCLHS